ncbi:MAG: prolyl oligopeptidase family serine peptidase [Usitatibacter sp.]
MPLLALVLLAGPALGQALQYPAAAKKNVSDTFFGTQVSEDYRWLEDGKDPAVRAWSLEQLKVTRSYLDAQPMREKLRERFTELQSTAPVRYSRFAQAGAFFAMKRQPPKNQPMLVMMKSAGDVAAERVLFDPNDADAAGHKTIDWFAPSLDGRFVAVSLSEKGSEDGSAHVIDTASGKMLADVVPRVQYPTGGGSLAWDAKSTGFYYTRYPQGSERAREDANFYQQVWFHKLGTPASADTYVIGREFPRIAETDLTTTRDGGYLLAAVANGDGGEHAFYLRGPHGKWTQVADFADKVKQAWLGFDGRLYALSTNGAPNGKVLAMPLAAPKLAEAKTVIPTGDVAITWAAPTATRIYVVYMAGGPSEIRVFDLAGKRLGTIPSEPISTNSIGERLQGDEILVGSSSYVSSLAWYRYSPATGKLERTSLAAPSKVSFADAEVVREMATSKDGTRIPVNIVMKKATKRDGSNPLLLTGYGGYGVNMQPGFSENRRVWLDAGGVYAVANLRGGGEFGEAWHLAGNLTRKQTVFDDMIAVARHLVDRGYTKPERLAAIGGSNGGLLMGAILTQRPELFRAIVSAVGVYDMLRVELTPNGAFNVTEFGTVKDRAQFEALYAYSPMHRVKDQTAYPAVLLTSGENDGRVDPSNSRKMAARLQAATSSGRPVLLRMSMDTGHGQGTPLKTRVEEDADTYAFLMSQLGMEAR